MRVFHSIADAKGLPNASVALGNFDGVHRGHQALFAEAARHGTPVAVTFDPHPGKVLQPELAPKLITPLHRKLELFAQYGLHAAVLQPFTRDYAATTPAEFEASLLDVLGAKHLVVGGDFTYGSKRAGTVDTLRAAAAQRNAQVHVVPSVTIDGVVASSSRVREYILEGRVSAAHKLLGRYFDLDGTVVTGKGRGRGIGFPTANVDTTNELRPGPGVYAVRAWIRDDTVSAAHTQPSAGAAPQPGRTISSNSLPRSQSFDVDPPPTPAWLPGAANIGVKPTFGGTEVTIEVHLIDFSGDLYGRALRVQFLERLRPEQRFGSITELSTQIQRDVDAARTVIARVRES